MCTWSCTESHERQSRRSSLGAETHAISYNKGSRFSSIDHRKLNGAFHYHKPSPLFSLRCTFLSRRNQGDPSRVQRRGSEGQQDYGRVSDMGRRLFHVLCDSKQKLTPGRTDTDTGLCHRGDVFAAKVREAWKVES